MFNNFGLGFVFQGIDKVSSVALKVDTVLKRVEQAGKNMGQGLNKGANLGAAGLQLMTAGAAGLKSTVALADYAGSFEQDLAKIKAVTLASEQEMATARDRVIQAGMETQYSPQEALASMQTLVTAGQTLKEAQATLTPVLDLAAGSLGQLTTDQAADSIVGTMNAYSMSADNASAVTNKLLRITQLTNFQTRDFQTALAKAAANGATFGTALDDVVISVGLLRNANIDASSSGTAFRESIRRIGSMQAQQDKLRKAGVETFDKETGKMRNIVDIVMDYTEATKGQSDEERNKNMALIFGARGMLMYNAIAGATFKRMRDGELVTLKGRDAIRAMRLEMAISGGEMDKVRQMTEGAADAQYWLERAQKEGGKTAEGFREVLLDNYAGQKVLLEGVMQTIGVLSGEFFAKLYRPFVSMAVDLTSRLANALNQMSPELKDKIAKMAMVGSAIMFVVGGVISLRLAVVALKATLRLAGISATGMGLALLKVVVIGALVAGAAYLIYKAYKENFGGIADFIDRVWGRLKLFGQGLMQAFTKGGFSGEIRKELNKAENAGIKRFIINIYALFHRLGQVWEGVKAGFSSVWDMMGPTFYEIGEALKVLFAEFGFVGDGMEGVTNGSSKGWKDFGKQVGVAIGQIVKILFKFIAIAIRVVTWIVRVGKMVFAFWLGVQKILWPVMMWMKDRFFEIIGLILGVAHWIENLGRKIEAWYQNSLKPALQGAADAFWAWVEAGKAVVDWWVANIYTPLWEGLGSIYNYIVGNLVAGWGYLTDGFMSGWKSLKENLWDPFMSLLETIWNKIKKIVDAYKSVREFLGYEDTISQQEYDDRLKTMSPDQQAAYARMREGLLGAGGASPATATAAAVAEKQRQSEEMQRRQVEVYQRQVEAERYANERRRQDMRIVLEVDGKTLAEVAADATAREDALSYRDG